VRGFLISTMALGAVWVFDWLALESRYSRSVWREANYHGERFNYEVKRWLHRASF
jgi:hypothetical protein